MGKRKKRKRGIRLIHIILLLIIFWVGKTLISQQKMIEELTHRKMKEAEEITQLEKEIEELNKEIENKDSLSFIEKVAREDLRMVRPREIIYIDKNKEDNPFRSFRK
ncbi:MAG: septum formation initiator family protein [Tissierellia bacterium]|nr:septum formation initiator family protein [Tissierellia bacterium]